MATLPTSPPTLPSASAICPDGTATTTTSASVASPPSRPTAVTAWAARSQRRASPPPTLPLPSTKMFTFLLAVGLTGQPDLSRPPGRARPPRPVRTFGTTLATAWSGRLGLVHSTPARPLDQLQALPAEVVRRPAVRWSDGAVLGHADRVAAAVGHRDRLHPRAGSSPGRGHRRMRLARPGPHRAGRVALGAAGGRRAGRDRPAGQRQHRRRPADLPARHPGHPRAAPRPGAVPGPVRGLRGPLRAGHPGPGRPGLPGRGHLPGPQLPG